MNASAASVKPQESVARMRVLHVIPGEPQTSEMIFARREARELRRIGIELDIFYLRSRLSPLLLLQDLRAFRKKIKEVQPDVVHAQFGTMTAFFCACASSVPVVVTYRGTDLNRDPSQTPIRSFVGRMLSRLAAVKAARIVCVTEGLRGRLWWGKEKAVVLPGSVDLDQFRPMSRHEARAALGWKVEEQIVLFNVGRFPKVKRPELAREAVRIASEIVGPVRLHVVDGSTEPDRMPSLYNAADCLLITSVCEGSPTVLREAMACNLPVVSVDVGDVRVRLKGDLDSRVVSDDAQEIGRAVAGVLNPPRRSRGRELVQDLSVEQFNRELFAQYQCALQSRGMVVESPVANQKLV